jgi:Skp family chaperone for outer membrane proteins
VKKYLLSSAVAAAVFGVCFACGCFTSSPVLAQPQPGISQGVPLPNIALVDVSYLLKRHTRLKAQLKELGDEAARVQKGFDDQIQDVTQQAKQLGPGGFKPGTEPYVQLEERLVKQKADIQAQVQLKQKEFATRESHLYLNAYREINEEVTAYCQQHGIAMAINFNGDPIHDEKPSDVARGISNPVVFYDRRLDITGYIKPRIERELPTANLNNGFTPPTNR